MGAEKCQKRVLVVEDNELNRKIAAQVIEDECILTECAIDGLEAVKKVREAPEHYFDLILMDVQMPHMDGYKATDCIRHLSQPEKANIPIIAMSANAFEEDKKKAFDIKMNDYITKPIDFQKMEEVLKHVLSKKNPLS